MTPFEDRWRSATFAVRWDPDCGPTVFHQTEEIRRDRRYAP